MQMNITGKNLEVTDSLREYVEKKMGRLDRYLPNVSDVRVELSVENARASKDRQVAQVTLRTKQAVLRAEEVRRYVRLHRCRHGQGASSD